MISSGKYQENGDKATINLEWHIEVNLHISTKFGWCGGKQIFELMSRQNLAIKINLKSNKIKNIEKHKKRKVVKLST